MVSQGDLAPAFSGELADGTMLRSQDYRGERHLILYFFPKDFTPGWTREAKGFRDRIAEITSRGAEVVGVSTDSAETHRSFAEKHDLPFPLISDRKAEIAAAFGVARLGGWLPTKRVTFVIDKAGIVRRVIRSELDIGRHMDEAVAALEDLESGG